MLFKACKLDSFNPELFPAIGDEEKVKRLARCARGGDGLRLCRRMLSARSRSRTCGATRTTLSAWRSARQLTNTACIPTERCARPLCIAPEPVVGQLSYLVQSFVNGKSQKDRIKVQEELLSIYTAV